MEKRGERKGNLPFSQTSNFSLRKHDEMSFYAGKFVVLFQPMSFSISSFSLFSIIFSLTPDKKQPFLINKYLQGEENDLLKAESEVRGECFLFGEIKIERLDGFPSPMNY